MDAQRVQITLTLAKDSHKTLQAYRETGIIYCRELACRNISLHVTDKIHVEVLLSTNM